MQQYLFYNFSGRTGPDYALHSFNSMHVFNGTIMRIGHGLTMPELGDSIVKVDLKGATVLPAFSDSHVHFLQTGICMSGCQLQHATTLHDIFDSIRTEYPIENDWILGWNLDESKLTEQRLPTCDELDKVDNRNKVWLARKDLHSAVANSHALDWARMHIPTLISDNGRISGSDYNKLCYLLLNEISDSDKKNALKLAEQQCYKKGVAYVHALEGSKNNEKDVILTSNFLSGIPLKSYLYHQSHNPQLAIQKGWKQLGGCLLVDGSFGTRTASMIERYSDNDTLGHQYLKAKEIESLLKVCKNHNLQLALHAIGDRAIETVASCYLSARNTSSENSPRNRIEHFILPTERALLNTKASHSMVGIQPAFDYYWGGKGNLYEQRLGTSRAKRCNPFRTMMNIGIQMGGGSDSPVTPIDPMLGIHALVNHSNRDEQLDINAAFSMFISEPHKLTPNKALAGQLQKGYLADFVCFSEDPLKVPLNKLKDIQPKSLYIGGLKVF